MLTKSRLSRIYSLLSIVISLFTFNVQGAQFTQIRSFNCDFDDNIFVTSAKIKLWNKASQSEVDISTANWPLVRILLGPQGPLKNLNIRSDSLIDFGDTGPHGDNLFKEQIQKALESHDDHWKGPSWNSFVEALEKPQTLKYTTIITARLHSPKSILAGLQVLKDKGLLPALPKIENIYAVGWPGSESKFKGPPQSKGPNDAEKKAKVMISLLDQIESQAVPPDAAYVDNQDDTTKAKLHLWGFSDDDFSNFSEARAVLSKKVASGKWPHIKIELFYTGLNNPNERPRAIIIKTDGTTRPALPSEEMHDEILTRLKSQKKAQYGLALLIKKLSKP